MVGCLMRLLLLPLTAGLLFILISLREPLPTFVFNPEGAEVPAAVIAGLFLWFAVLSAMDIRRYFADSDMVNKSLLRDGERAVVSGPIEPKAPLLKAPFSGKECIGYLYRVSHMSKGPKSKLTRWTDYEGYALIPVLLQSPRGSLKILAEPDKELFYEIPFVSVKNESEQFGSYLKTRDFGKNVRGPGDFCVDEITGSPPDLKTCDFEEKVVQSGDTVLIEGIYSSGQGGIAPDPDSIMRPFHLVPGGEVGLRRKLRNRYISAAIGTALCCATIAIYFIAYAAE